MAQGGGIEGETVMTMGIALDLATDVEVARIDRGSALYDLDAGRLNMVFTNRGVAPLTFPAEAIMRRVVRTYRDTQTRAVQSFNKGGPPASEAELMELAPGESWTYGVGLELPGQLLQRDVKVVTVQVCVTWDKASLDAGLYPAGSYDWAESFSVCRDVVLRQ